MTHAVGLMMHRVLDSEADGGLGLRRCQWKCHSMNEKSKAAAVRLGFVPEGTIRAWVVVPPGRPSIHGECGVRGAANWQMDDLAASRSADSAILGCLALRGTSGRRESASTLTSSSPEGSRALLERMNMEIRSLLIMTKTMGTVSG